MYDTIIIGGGVTAMAAGIYAGRFQMKTLLIGKPIGGTILNTDEIANYPGWKSISGMDLARNFEEHMKEYGIETVEKTAESITTCPDGCFFVHAGGKSYNAKTLIFATGTEYKKLGVPGEEKYKNKGVHYCALCDAPLYQDKIVAVIGGADSAAKEALLLSKYAKKVYIVAKGEKLRPEPINLKLVEENEKIEVITDAETFEITGEAFVTSLMIEVNGEKRELAVEGIFVNVGHDALSGLAKEIGVRLNGKGEIMVDRESKTDVPGVYAAGDVTDSNFKQAITGVGQGVQAAFTAYHFVNESDSVCYCDEDEHRKRNAR